MSNRFGISIGGGISMERESTLFNLVFLIISSFYIFLNKLIKVDLVKRHVQTVNFC